MTRISSFRKLFLLSGIVLAFALTANASANELFQALRTTKAGDTIELPGTDLGRIHLRNLSYTEPVTVRFSDETRISRLTLENVSGMRFENMNLVAGTTDRPQAEKAVRVMGGSHVTISNSSFQWSADGKPTNDGSAIMVDGVDHFTLENSTFTNSENGIHVRSSTNAVIRGNSFRGMMVDGIILSGTTGALLENNFCTEFTTPDPKLHPDCIQLQAGGRKVANTSVIIRGNKVIKGKGARTQGIFVKSRFDDIPHKDILIENNVVEIAKGNGIYGKSVIGLTIRNNVVRPSENASAIPRIVIREPAHDVLIEGNTTPEIVKLHDTVVGENNIVEYGY